MLRRDEFVTELARVSLRAIEDLIELPRQCRLRIRLFRVASHLAPDRLAQLRDAHAKLLKNGHHDALVLREQSEQQMQIVYERISGMASEVDRLAHRLGGFHCQTICIYHIVTVGY